MSLLSLPLPIPIPQSSKTHYNTLRLHNSRTFHFHKNLRLSVWASAIPVHRNSATFPASGEFLRQIAASTVLFISLGTGVGKSENVEDNDDEELRAAFEKWKSKTYALTVPLRVVSLSNSFPPLWLKDFLRSQGKRVRLHSEFRQSLQDIFHELCMPNQKGKVNPKSALAADVVTLGDT